MITWICPQCNSTVETEYRDPRPTCSNKHGSFPMAIHGEEYPESRRLIAEAFPTHEIELRTQRVSAGPFKWAAMTAFICVFLSALAWIWLGDWQWGPTAAVLLFGGIFLREASLKQVPPSNVHPWDA